MDFASAFAASNLGSFDSLASPVDIAIASTGESEDIVGDPSGHTDDDW